MKILLAVVFSMTGCVATSVTAPGGIESAYAPSNESSRPGVIKYLNQGADFVIKNRREDAYKQMFTACKGKYTIDSEGEKPGDTVIQQHQGLMIASDTKYWYITYSCTKQ